MFFLSDACQSSGHGFIWQMMGQDVSLYPISPLDFEILVHKNSSPLVLYELFYIWGPILLFREFMALFLSFLSFWLSLLRFSMRETWQEIGKSLFEFKFFHLRSLWPGSFIVFLRCSLPTCTSCLKVGRILGNHVCECAIETVGAVQMQMKYMILHISILLPRPLLPTRNKCFASVVSGWDFTCISHLFHLPLPGDRYTLFNFPSQLAKDLPHYF